ncbi:SAM-dependent methyltransferase [Tomitella fengzijianii]|uniref:S-adenosyl-L-methionine-dependent methyltransferase n=1 Tax=Tomitella fengzijianii TaxID=2597660 RepID=A0A516X4S3_9ACTN|nr:SAM-dependent methyltransferase [Tomitella fengzijianii]QDQ98066.1 SAM-dependent methyltransferase [Tomitella fengzijianii]
MADATGEGDAVPVDGIAVTAIGVAVIRAREDARPDRLYSDPLARAFVDAARAGFPPERWARLEALAGQFYEGRTVGVRLVDHSVQDALDHGIRQFVLLGAGLDTRAFRMGLPPDTVVFELDLPETFAFKEPVLERAGAVPSCTRRVIPADLRAGWRHALLDNGFRPEIPTQWVDEGTLGNPTEDWKRRLVEDLTALSAVGSRFGVGRFAVDAESPQYREYRNLTAGDKGAGGERAGEKRAGGASTSGPWGGPDAPGRPTDEVELWLRDIGWDTRFRGWNAMTAGLGRDVAQDDPGVGTVFATRR